MDMLDAMMAIGGMAFVLIAGGIYLLFSSGLVELPSASGDGYMEVLQPGLEELGFQIVEVGDIEGTGVILMKDDQANFMLACEKDPTKTLVQGNESKVYEGDVVEGSVFGDRLFSVITSSFYEDGYLCLIGSKSGRARNGVSGIRNVIDEYGTVVDK